MQMRMAQKNEMRKPPISQRNQGLMMVAEEGFEPPTQGL
jgi:hypothetical protein